MKYVMAVSFLCLIFHVHLFVGSNVPKIGIVGGGIGGSSAAFFLRKLFGSEGAVLHVYEYKKIGGRLATEKVGDCDYEVGGAVIHPKNKYMVDFANLFGLKKRNDAPSSFGLYNGEDFVFRETRGWQLWNTIKLLWRYGFDLFKLNNFIESMLDHFARIYTLQENGISFTTVEEMLAAMSEDFVKYLHISSKSGFKKDRFSERVINELIQATLLVNYGQTTDVHKFVGAVSVAGGMPGLWAVQGGNWQVAENLLESSNATIIKAKVLNITLMPERLFQVAYEELPGNVKWATYDIVIIAAPVAKNVKPNINFVAFPQTFLFPGNYHQTISTLVLGDLNNTFFGIVPGQIQEILTINDKLLYNSIGKIQPVTSKNATFVPVWKVFSHEPLTKEQLDKLFYNIQEVKSVRWLAYPHYDVQPSTRKFVLYDNLYHVNAIEWAASAMEMSVIGARNVALLAYNKWHGTVQVTAKSETKDEL